MQWNKYPENKPEILEEVVVLVDGHRSPSWRNNYCVVAYLDSNGKWYEERHGNEVVGVLSWFRIPYHLMQ